MFTFRERNQAVGSGHGFHIIAHNSFDYAICSMFARGTFVKRGYGALDGFTAGNPDDLYLLIDE